MDRPQRRQGLRVHQDRPAKVYDARARRYYAGRALDMGAKGMKLLLPAGCPIQTGGTLQVYVGQDDEHILLSLANMTPVRVIWVETMATRDPKHITVGVELALLNAASTRRQRKVA